MATAGTSAKFLALQAILSTTIYALELAIIAAIYGGLGNIAVFFPAISAIETPLWPPTGVALALVLLRGYRIWPAIFIGSFSASAISAGALTVQPLAIGVG